MNTGRVVLTGKTRVCPHCKSTILESSSVCPACQHHLRFDPRSGPVEWTSVYPLRVEGKIRHPAHAQPWEYSIVLTIRDDRGEELARQVLGVGAIKPSEERSFELSVEVLTPVAAEAEARQA